MHDENEYDDGDDFPDEEHEPRPLDRQEAARVRRDLDDLAAFRHTFEPEGFKGVSVFCEDCVEEHFYTWEMLEQNLTALLESGETPVHEPAYDPRPEEYIDWQYAQGYLDGLADAGAPMLPAQLSATGGCPFCGGDLPGDPQTVVYCPTCGSHLAPARIAFELLRRGWKPEDVSELLRGARVPPMRGVPGRQDRRDEQEPPGAGTGPAGGSRNPSDAGPGGESDADTGPAAEGDGESDAGGGGEGDAGGRD